MNNPTQPLFSKEEIEKYQSILKGVNIFTYERIDGSDQTYEEYIEETDDEDLTEEQYNAICQISERTATIQPTYTEQESVLQPEYKIPRWATCLISSTIDSEAYVVFLPFPIDLSTEY